MTDQCRLRHIKLISASTSTPPVEIGPYASDLQMNHLKVVAMNDLNRHASTISSDDQPLGSPCLSSDPEGTID